MKTVLILGATSGIARSVTSLFIEKGYQVILAGRDSQKIQEIADDLEIRSGKKGIQCLEFDALSTDIHFAFYKEVLQRTPDLFRLFHSKRCDV